MALLEQHTYFGEVGLGKYTGVMTCVGKNPYDNPLFSTKENDAIFMVM